MAISRAVRRAQSVTTTLDGIYKDGRSFLSPRLRRYNEPEGYCRVRLSRHALWHKDDECEHSRQGKREARPGVLRMDRTIPRSTAAVACDVGYNAPSGSDGQRARSTLAPADPMHPWRSASTHVPQRGPHACARCGTIMSDILAASPRGCADAQTEAGATARRAVPSGAPVAARRRKGCEKRPRQRGSDGSTSPVDRGPGGRPP